MNEMPIPLKAMWGLIKCATHSWVDDYASSMGAALADEVRRDPREVYRQRRDHRREVTGG
jgi:hypothetical protein